MSGGVAVGLDGTRESLAAAGWAAREALARDASLELVQVRETGAYPSSPIVVEDQVELGLSEKITGEVAEELARRHPELRTTITMVAGRPSRVLTDLSHRTGLLVLGSRGLSGAVGYVMGSTALGTVAHAVCPVVLVRAEQDEDGMDAADGGDGTGAEDGRDTRDAADAESAEGGPHRARHTARDASPVTAAVGDIVLGLDLGRPCDALIDFAFRAASLHARRLRVLHGWHLPPALGSTPSYPVGMEITEQMQAEETRMLRDALRPWHEKFPDVDVVRAAVPGRAQEILKEAAEDASLLVVGRRIRQQRLGTHIGPVAHAVVHHVRTPVAVVPHA
ncbi:nucleotide-binding universal stress UspA family protein [Streptomyces sp. Amel2xB2]|uniref:universal stress protein n=1 Tax=Streptomyces sp. Amel2xB2 TaxID=1305829 RepID=UPI000DBA7AD2|nr:universal stress protein [Streptomyces sp. Amel2xB2]RAJ59989.1 nucleotide-binding universal stress UspA family protein [Streptomyces sp. Amel2xB2]